MNSLICSSSSWANCLLSVLRIVVALLFMEHGGQKLFGFPAPRMGGAAPEMFSQMWVAGVLELFGGLLFLLGLFTRPVAFILSGMMAVAYFTVHAKGGWSPLVNKGELAVLYCFVYFYFSFAGGGNWSLDNLICRKKSTARK
jgi:putative oxidoreductase